MEEPISGGISGGLHEDTPQSSAGSKWQRHHYRTFSSKIRCADSTIRSALFGVGLHLLFFLLGLAPWLLVNSLFMELPVFIRELPEGNSIASYIVVVIQLGNVIPLLYVVLRQYMRISYNWVVFGTLSAGIATAVLISLFWDHTAHLFGSDRSVALLGMTLFAGLVGCFSVVSFFPFASLFKHSITAALSAGMGLNGLLPSLMAILQEPGQDPLRFSVGVFFEVSGLVLVLALMAYLAIVILIEAGHPSRMRPFLAAPPGGGPPEFSLKHEQHLLADSEADEQVSEMPPPPQSLPAHSVLLVLANPLINQFYICMINYALIGVLPYAVNGFTKYGTWLMWINIAATVTGSVGRLLCSWLRHPSLTFFSFVQTPLWIFLIVVSIGNGALVPESAAYSLVIGNGLFALINGWEDTMAYIKVASEHPEIAERACTFVATANQAGAFVGSLASFLVVYFYLS